MQGELESAGEILTVLRLAAEVERLQANIRFLLEHVAAWSRPCSRCQAQIFFVRHSNGVSAPYNPDGSSHFANCPHAAEFRRKGAR